MMIGILFLIFFSVWLVFSVINQFGPKWMNKVKKYDYFSLIPKWTFFAPNPGSTDYHLLYRDILDDGEICKWTPVISPDNRSLVTAIWNPQKRVRKAQADIVRALIRLPDEKKDSINFIYFTLPYLLLLNTVTNIPCEPNVKSRQFMVMETSGFNRRFKPRLLIQSGVHDVG
jgi:hypothetical protein